MTSTVTPLHPLNTAVLFLVFNRPDTTARVFDAIRQAKPLRLYVAADGPRSDREGEAEKVAKVREIATAVDWTCEVKTLFREKNLGCKYAVSSAITWFFEQEEMGVIIEDDVFPSRDFFYFAEDNLEKYQNDTRVMMITGTNYLPNVSTGEPFFFSEHFTIWGWATWRRAWQLYDLKMRDWNSRVEHEFFRNKFATRYIFKHFRNTFNALSDDCIDTWDIQWVFSCLMNSGLCLTPHVNLVSNIGVEGTHGSGVTDSHFLPTEEITRGRYINFYPYVQVNYQYDLALHELKNRRAVRKVILLGILKKLRLFTLLRSLKRKFLRIKRP